MAAYPFRPMSNERLKDLSGIIKDFKPTDTESLQKDHLFPDSIISKTTCPVTDQTCNHPQTDNS